MYRIVLAVLVAFTPTLVLAAETEKAEEPATLNVVTVPGYVEIKVNSETIGFAPIRDFALPSGEHVISASFNETEPIEKTVFLVPGVTTDVWFYSADGTGDGWFRGRDYLIGIGLFGIALGLGLVIGFNVVEMQ
ncbi:MAG: hypothetical protein JSW52_03570 [Candidatus Coatesbacteria bacterium]|nr:MAG: hypothetical protein JSW52_03570 [Candidatus Coatesbacteria bacterium]